MVVRMSLEGLMRMRYTDLMPSGYSELARKGLEMTFKIPLPVQYPNIIPFLDSYLTKQQYKISSSLPKIFACHRLGGQ